MTPKSRGFHESVIFLENRREATRELLVWLAIVSNCFRVSCHEFRRLHMFENIWLTSMSFQLFDDFRGVLMLGGCVAGP